MAVTVPAQGRVVKPLLMNALLFVLLVATLFSYPYYSRSGLDPSWAMALGHFFHDGLQFGPEVAFTYGPLGFLLANTYVGWYFWSLIFWQMLTAAVFAIVIIDGAQLLTGIRKIIYFGFFLFVGSWSYIDVPYSIIIAMIGFELIRRSGKDGLPSTYLLVLFLALLASTKFTHLILASFSVLIVGVLALLRGRWRIALLLSSCFLAGYLALWIASGQNLSNIPVYLYNSWQINQGYQQAMGLPTPRQPLWLGVTTLITLSLYGLLYLILHFGQPLMLPRFTLLAAFIFLIWKHGFIRSDGHMLIFFVNALLPIIAFPVLLDDLPGRRWPSQLLLGFAGLLCMLGIGVNRQDDSLSIWRAPSQIQDKLRHHYDLLGHWASVRVSYEHQLAKERQRFDLPRTREVIGQATIDVLGYEQAIALYNGFTYRPRPVFQSYFAYTPHLAGLNDHFYRSSLAPDYVLLKLQSIDNRFPTLDDSLLLRSFVHRYDYVHTERGFQLWKRRSQPPRESSELAAPLRSEMLKLNRPLELGELTSKRLWATLRVEASWLGRLRNALYKPPIVTLAAKDTQGRSATFRLALPQAATGFILNPLIENGADYLCFAMGAANRQVYTLMLEVAQKDLKFFSETAHLKLSELSSAPSGQDCRGLDMGVLFWMFQSYPITYEAPVAPSETEIDGRPAVMMHAPSTMEFAVPAAATMVSGAFGFAAGAYTGSGQTDGATFRILWEDKEQQVELYQRRLDPRTVPGDQGLQDFRVKLQRVPGGRVVLQVDPGLNSNWDWTAWTEIKID